MADPKCTLLPNWKKRWRGFSFPIAQALVLAASSFASACPNCKLGLLDNGLAGENLARGFELSIYLMLATPMLILSGLGLLFYTQVRRAHANSSVAEIEPTNVQEDWTPASNGSVAK